MIEEGGLKDQPNWWVELLGWFIPRYDQIKFNGKVKSVLGDGKSKSKNIQQVVNTYGRNNR